MTAFVAAWPWLVFGALRLLDERSSLAGQPLFASLPSCTIR